MRNALSKLPFVTTFAALALALAACGSSDDAAGESSAAPADPGPGATGISQGGAQDFGLFRQILEDGGIPAPDTLDDLGFFAEHKLDYPAPSCGGDVCMHGLLGVMGNMISGSSCTLIQIGMNSICVSVLNEDIVVFRFRQDVIECRQGAAQASNDCLRITRDTFEWHFVDFKVARGIQPGDKGKDNGWRLVLRGTQEQ